MAHGQANSKIKKHWRQPPVLKDQGGVFGVHTACLSRPSIGKQPQDINKQQAVRKSSRLRAIQQLRKQSIFKSDLIPRVQAPPSPQINNISKGRRVCASTAPDPLSYRWPYRGSTASTDPSQPIGSPAETEMRARSWTFFTSRRRPASFEATANLAFKLHCWRKSGKRHQWEERRSARVLDPDQKVAWGISRTRQPG